MTRRRGAFFGAVLVALFVPTRPPILAQQEGEDVSRQLWGNYILGFPKSSELYHEVDFDAAVEVEGAGSWWYLYATNMVESTRIVFGWNRRRERCRCRSS